MNRFEYLKEHIGMRTALANCFINIQGETHPCTIAHVTDRNYLDVTYERKTISIHLSHVLLMSDPVLYYFQNSDPHGLSGTLVIPSMGVDTEDDEDDDDDIDDE